ncbi:MAG: hypothetical protein J7497_02365 [Chitinophagaceae bacterium]|nr:hypothetical protein [Chitinophagaceae bacterium]
MSVINKKQIAEQFFNNQQQRTRQSFTDCAEYSTRAKNDEKLRLMYELFCRPGSTPSKTAFHDAKNAPIITNVNASDYNGNIDDVIIIEAYDDFEVDSIKVIIVDPEDQLIESGFAVRSVKNDKWAFVTKVLNEKVSGSKIKVCAYDIPGNKTIFKQIL